MLGVFLEITMRFLVTVAYWEGVVLVGGLFGIVLWKLSTGGMPLKGLLDGNWVFY
jgi:hypothetical protein